MDPYNALLQGDLNEEVYIQLLEEFGKHGEHKVSRLLNHCIGSNKPQDNGIKFIEASINGGYSQSKHDCSLFTRRRDGKSIILFVYMDDTLL